MQGLFIRPLTPTQAVQGQHWAAALGKDYAFLKERWNIVDKI